MIFIKLGWRTFLMIKLFLILILNVSVLLFISCDNKTENKSQIVQKTDKTKIIGEWLRTDSDYMIKIVEVNDNGSMLAQYFNPKPINVETAKWESISGDLKIIIELKDVNYPGSTYTLNYLPDKDMLAGEYYQAVEGLTFYVEFTRYDSR
jgi:hypothetical protein